MSYALENHFYIKPRGETWDDNPLYAFDNSQIVMNSPKGVFSSDIIGNELAVDTFSFTVRFNAFGRRLYVFDNTPKLAYIFSGYVPGTLESCGWISQTRGNPTIAGNSVAFASSSDGFYLRPPASVRESRQFLPGDVLRLKIKVSENADRLYFYDTQSQDFTVESKTGLFTFVNVWVSTYAYTMQTGTDVLTFTQVRAIEPGIISVYSRAAAQFEICGLEFNGSMVFGSFSDDYEGDKPPKIYLFKPKYSASNFLADLAFGDPCYWAVGDEVFAKGYISNIERTGRYAWKVTCVSGVGLLDEKISVGGIYTGQTFSSVFAAIVGNTISYSIDEDVAAVKIYGWLPYDTARNNLHRLLFATGAALVRHNISSDGVDLDYDVRFPGTVIRVVPEDHVALSGSVTLNIPADGVEITEHAFVALQNDEEVQLYDNTLPEIAEADHLTVTFSEPMHDLTVSDPTTLTINESGVNYAVITGTGILTGKAYTHTETVYPLGNPLGKIVKRIVSNGLITFANSLNVARRILNYFQSAKSVKAKLMLNDENGTQSVERPGETLQMTDAWGESISAYMAKQEVGVTSIYGANCELVDGYTPTGGGNNYQRYRFFTRQTATKTFVADADGDIRIVLIQGGTGGQGGEAGHVGMGGDPTFDEEDEGRIHPISTEIYNAFWQLMGYGWQRCYQATQQGMPGGAAGEPGAGGKILVVNKSVLAGDIITFTQIGAGGSGSASFENGGTATDGAGGTHTIVSCTRNGSVIWTASSEDGAVSPSGYFEAFTNQTFSLSGEAGHAGGMGGQTSVDSLTTALTAASGLSGGSVGRWSGGPGGKGVSHYSGMRGQWDGGEYGPLNDVGCGGGGGGAAWGANGEPGKAAKLFKDPESGGIVYESYVLTGCGGKGADASQPAKPTYGQGGGGGNGGGSGGNSGGGTAFRDIQNHGWGIQIGHPSGYSATEPYGGGLGGLGSSGGDGGDGLGILYY